MTIVKNSIAIEGTNGRFNIEYNDKEGFILYVGKKKIYFDMESARLLNDFFKDTVEIAESGNPYKAFDTRGMYGWYGGGHLCDNHHVNQDTVSTDIPNNDFSELDGIFDGGADFGDGGE